MTGKGEDSCYVDLVNSIPAPPTGRGSSPTPYSAVVGMVRGRLPDFHRSPVRPITGLQRPVRFRQVRHRKLPHDSRLKADIMVFGHKGRKRSRPDLARLRHQALCWRRIDGDHLEGTCLSSRSSTTRSYCSDTAATSQNKSREAVRFLTCQQRYDDCLRVIGWYTAVLV